MSAINEREVRVSVIVRFYIDNNLNQYPGFFEKIDNFFMNCNNLEYFLSYVKFI